MKGDQQKAENNLTHSDSTRERDLKLLRNTERTSHCYLVRVRPEDLWDKALIEPDATHRESADLVD